MSVSMAEGNSGQHGGREQRRHGGREQRWSVAVDMGGNSIGCRSGAWKLLKNESENEIENDDFWKIDGYARFLENDHFSVHFCLILKKNEVQNEIKMSQKWPENVYRERPYL
jgi:hypothetical protein